MTKCLPHLLETNSQAFERKLLDVETKSLDIERKSLDVETNILDLKRNHFVLRKLRKRNIRATKKT